MAGKFTVPNPGSVEAREIGCICPVYDNHHGRGLSGFGEQFGWVINEDCPIHKEKEECESISK